MRVVPSIVGRNGNLQLGDWGRTHHPDACQTERLVRACGGRAALWLSVFQSLLIFLFCLRCDLTQRSDYLPDGFGIYATTYKCYDDRAKPEYFPTKSRDGLWNFSSYSGWGEFGKLWDVTPDTSMQWYLNVRSLSVRVVGLLVCSSSVSDSHVTIVRHMRIRRGTSKRSKDTSS